MTLRSAVLSAAALLCLAAPAVAEDCGPLQRVLSLDMTPVSDGARLTVPVSINGEDKKFLLDTASGATTLTADAAEKLSLRSSYSEGSRLLDSDGNASRHFYTVKELQIANVRAHNLQLMQTPDPVLGKDLQVDGILAPDLMNHYDVELDFVARKLNYFVSTNKCGDHVVYWPASSVGSVPINLHKRSQDMVRAGEVVQAIDMSGYMSNSVAGKETSAGGDKAAIGSMMGQGAEAPSILGIDIVTSVLLDGKPFTAVIDTGAEMSVLNSTAARAVFDVTADSPGSTPAGSSIMAHAGQKDPKVSESVTVLGSRAFEHTFHTLSFGGVTVTAPHFLVRPDRTGANDPENTFITGSHTIHVDDAIRPDISIGMDVLKKLHLYFAFKDGHVYVTSSEPPTQQSSVQP